MKTKLSGIITLLLAFVVQITFAQEQAITGTVSDEIGPLPGVSVIIEGTSTGTETDFDGNYSITANTGATLRYSFVGMATLSKIVGNQNIINVTMVSESNTLDEVIVTALGIKREAKSLGYSVQAVKGEDMVTTRQTDISTALAGKVSGVQFTGQPTSTFKNANIRLRGSSGVLYVVDGVKLNSSSDINTDEIESMNVLKSLSATALFGPEGRNGAIVIITKKAKSGESNITVNSSVAFDKVYILPEYQDEYGGGYANDGKPTGHPERYTNAIGYFTPFSFNPAAHSADWASFDGDLMPSYFADESWGPKMEGQMVRHWDSWIEGDPEFGKLRAWEANPDGIRNFFQTGLTTNNSVSFAKGGEDFSIRSSIG
ncbi:MAG: carboxypeptidase-like regulatory domain-containing protein, partial [Flavobacteriaceae bacterium]|nr:carboxypeptidase-like regulatory domain-containing protein [Flavobacteriaceae bacterium]